jgi:hypothetical protein
MTIVLRMAILPRFPSISEETDQATVNRKRDARVGHRLQPVRQLHEAGDCAEPFMAQEGRISGDRRGLPRDGADIAHRVSQRGSDQPEPANRRFTPTEWSVARSLLIA